MCTKGMYETKLPTTIAMKRLLKRIWCVPTNHYRFAIAKKETLTPWKYKNWSRVTLRNTITAKRGRDTGARGTFKQTKSLAVTIQIFILTSCCQFAQEFVEILISTKGKRQCLEWHKQEISRSARKTTNSQRLFFPTMKFVLYHKKIKKVEWDGNHTAYIQSNNVSGHFITSHVTIE